MLGVAVNSIQVARGTQSRERGGTSYKPTYILDAVLLSEHIHCMDDMKQVVTEHLAFFVFIFFLHTTFKFERSLRNFVDVLLDIFYPQQFCFGKTYNCSCHHAIIIFLCKVTGNDFITGTSSPYSVTGVLG